MRRPPKAGRMGKKARVTALLLLVAPAAAAGDDAALTGPPLAMETGDVEMAAELVLAQPPMPATTVPPRFEGRYFKRQTTEGDQKVVTIGSNSCGFYNGELNSAWSCNARSLTCLPTSSRIACCLSTTSCFPNTYTACIPSSASSVTVCPVDAASSGTICCFSAIAANCVTNIWITAGETATAVGCAGQWDGLVTLSNYPDDKAGTTYVREEDAEAASESSVSAADASTSDDDGGSTTVVTTTPTPTPG